MQTYAAPIYLIDAFDQTLATTNRGARARRDWHSATMYFVRYLVANRPEIENWNQLTRPIIRQYLESLAGRSPNRKRLLLQPIIQTDKFLNREHALPPIAQGLRIGSALPSSEGDFMAQLCKDLATLGVVRPLGSLDSGPFAVSRHT